MVYGCFWFRGERTKAIDTVGHVMKTVEDWLVKEASVNILSEFDDRK